jgi:uncharacterized protein (DUF58 family)
MVLDGFMFGAHPSRLQGSGVEFSQYRSYQPGDDPRRLDWRLFARSDRYYIRESEAETSVTVRLVLDASDSMRQEENGVSKLAYSRMLAATLALLAFRQGDAFSLVTAGAGTGRAGRPDRGRAHLNRLLHELERIEAAGVWPGWERLQGALLGGAGRTLTFVISDLHERSGEIRGAIRRLAALRHDVRVVRVVGRAEAEFGYAGAVTFEELETESRIEVDAATARLPYLESFAREERALALEMGEYRASYARVFLDEPLDAALRSILGSGSAP